MSHSARLRLSRGKTPIVLAAAVALSLAGCAGLPAGPGGPPERRDAALQAALEQAVQGFHGEVGVYVRNLKDGRTASLRADELFPTASMVKVPILAGLFDRLDRGELRYDPTTRPSSTRARTS